MIPTCKDDAILTVETQKEKEKKVKRMRQPTMGSTATKPTGTPFQRARKQRDAIIVHMGSHMV
jgi:hypothetical protein